MDPSPIHKRSYSMDHNAGFNLFGQSSLFDDAFGVAVPSASSQLATPNHGVTKQHVPKSFLDDDWLQDRVEHDQNMARVAGGLLTTSRNGNNNPKMDILLHEQLEDSFVKPHRMSRSSNAFASVHPPGDYVCRLCGVAGHWLKDCALFEPRPRTNSTSTTTYPPANYVCRLCGVAGHWIEDCAMFEHRNSTTTAAGGPFTSASTNPMRAPRGNPPSNYVCNLCQHPGHWIQNCALFKPMKPTGTPRTPQAGVPRDQHGHVIIRRPSQF